VRGADRSIHLRALRIELLEQRALLSIGAGLPEYADAARDDLVSQGDVAATDGGTAQFRHIVFDPTSGEPAKDAESAARESPGVAARDMAPLSSSSPVGLTPQQIRTAYGINLISLGAIVGDGSGQTIAIVDAYDAPNFVSSSNPNFANSDLHKFDLQFGLPDPPSFLKLDQNGGTNYPAASGTTGWSVESSLDVEWAHAIAPQANIILVEANDPSYANMFAAVDYARHAAGVVAVSMSWGSDEFSSQTTWDSYLTTPSGHGGVTFLASTGDAGSPGGFPAFSPNVVAVGGTTLTLSGNNYVGETGWSGSGGGQSGYETEPSYQNAVQHSGWRQIPDVSFDADPASGVAVYDSYDYGSSAPWIQVGGTSLSAPCWAGLIAIADQLRAAEGFAPLDGRAQALPNLYAMPAIDFHDITSGSNGGYSAGAGYDLVTGLGSPVADKLVPDFVPSLPAGSVAFSAESYEIGTSAMITVRDSNAASCQVSVVSSAGDSESLVLASQGSGVFQGTIATSGGAVAQNDGRLETLAGGTITVTYNDADDGTGHPRVVSDQASTFNHFQITTESPLPPATIPYPYSVTLEARGGLGAYTWSTPSIGNYTESNPGTGWLGGGTAQGWHADDSSWSLALPWAFPYYGVNRTSVWVCSNGFLDFTSSSASYTNSQSALKSAVRIAPLWDDLVTDLSGDDIFVTSNASYVAVRWAAHTYSGSYPVNAEVVLYPNGDIKFNYGAAQSGLSPTIGVSAGDNVHYTFSSRDGAGSIPANVSSLLSHPTALPPGLTLSSAGVLSGTPTGAPGGYYFPVTVVDAASPQHSLTRYYLLDVRNEHVHHFAFNNVGNQIAGTASPVTISAYNSLNNVMSAYNGMVALSGLGESRLLPIDPTLVTFASGAATTNVTINATEPSARLRVDDGRVFALSNTFAVQSGPLDHFQWSTVASSQYQNVPFSATVTAQDTRGYTVTGFAGTANLGGYTLQSVQIGTGTSSWGFPLYTYYHDARTQVIYRASELGGGGPIAALSLDVTTPPGQVMNNWTIRMKHTSLASYSTYAWEGPSSGWTTVYQSNQSITTTGWVTFTFATPFQYNGVDNLMIDFSFNNSSYTSAGASRYTSSGSTRTLYSYSDSGYGDPLNWSGSSSPTPTGSTYVPNLQLARPHAVSVSPATVTFTDGIWGRNAAEKATVLQAANNVYLRIDDGAGHVRDSNTFNVLPAALTIAVPPDASEGVGTVAATVGVSAALGSDLVVNLSSSDPGRAAVPASVTLPAGQTSLPFAITIVDNAVLDGTEAVVISATATGSMAASGTITVHDNETATLTVSLPASAHEGEGVLAGAGTVTASQAPTRDIAVQLVSNDTSEVTVPATVTIPAGQTSANFNVTIVDDPVIDGTQTAAVTASVENWTSGSASINVLDNDATISMTLPADAWEGQGVLSGAGTVRIGGTFASDVVVSLASNDLTELSVPATVTIPAGQLSATFDLTIQDDGEFDGPQTVQVTATATGFTGASASMVVRDNELDHFGFDAISSPKAAGVPFAVTARAYDVLNNAILVYSGTAALSGLGQSGPLPITPTSITFASGVWTGNVTVSAVDPSVTLRVDNGSGAAGTSNAITVYEELQVTSTTPPPSGALTLPGPFTYDVTFNQPIAPASATTSSLLLSGISGATVTGVTVLPGNTTARFTLGGITVEGTLSTSMPAGAVTDQYGNSGAAFSASYFVDIGTAAFPVPLSGIAPAGSLIYDPTVSGVINPSGDTDMFTLAVDPGQTIAVLVTPTSSGLQPSVQLLDPTDAVIGTATAAAAGQNALIQATPTTGTTSGTCKIVVGGAASTTGNYTVQVTLNAALEIEGRIAGSTNNTSAAAQDINGSFNTLAPLASSARRGAVLGQTDATGTPDYYSFTVAASETDTLAITSLAPGNVNLELFDGSGTLIATGTGGATNLTKLVSNFNLASPGTYYACVTGDSNVPYSLVITRNAGFDTEPNDSFATAQSISGTQGVLGYISPTGTGVEPDDYAAGTTLTNVVTGITLTTVGSTNVVTSRSSSYTSTGSRVFGNGTSSTWTVAINLRASFAVPVSSVSLDLVPDDINDPGFLKAYDSGGNLLQDLETAAPPFPGFLTMTITRPTADIAYVVAGGQAGQVVYLDRLVVGGGAGGGDWYAINVTGAANEVHLATTTPADGPGEFANSLAPHIELYDPSGTLVASGTVGADGRNESIDYVGAVPGVYRVHVLAKNGTQGEYFLAIANQLTFTVPANATEGDGTVAAAVSIPVALGSDVVVDLTSSDPGRAAVPANVTIAAGQTSAPLPITIIDNTLLDGIEPVVITANAAGYLAGSGTITVHDNETATLSVSLPASAHETAGVLLQAGTVTASQAPTREIAVQLVSGDITGLTVPATVTLPAGQTVVSFDITMIDDHVIQAPRPVSVTAQVENWTSGSATISVLDDDASITVTLPADAWEGQGVLAGAGTVRIGGTLASDVVVSLVSNDLTELSVPATVTIPAGQLSATFDLAIVDDSERDGPQSVQVTASATGLSPGSTTMLVRDNDVDHFGFDAISSPQTVGAPFAVTARAWDAFNNAILVYNGPGTLSGLGESVPLPISPTSITFASGVWTGNVTVNAVEASARLRADDGSGVFGTSNSFAVQSGPLDHFQWSTVGSPQYVNTPFTTTLTAVDSHGYTVADFAGTANLAGYGGGENVQIGTGTSTWGYPLRTSYHDSRTQVIYLASEVAGSGSINALSLYVTTVPGQVMNNWTIRMKHTSLGSYTTYAWEGPSSGWTTVYQTNQSITTTGWVTFTFTTPFMYNGVDNLMIDFSFNNSSSSTSGYSWYSSIGATRSLYYYTNSLYGDPLNWSGTSSPSPYGSSYVPNIQLAKSTAVGVAPAATGNFTNGAWSGSVTVLAAAAQVRLRASDAGGHTGASNAFDVLASPLAGFQFSTIGSPQVQGEPFPVTLTAQDASGSTLTSFNGTSNLAGYAAAIDVPIGTGTSTWAFPLRTSYHDARTQVIYLAGEIGGGGLINSLSLDVTAVPGQVMNNWTIRLKHTSLGSYSTYAWEGPSSGWTTVYQANQSITTTGWVTFTFTTPFAYNGVDNLMVDFSFNNSSYSTTGYSRYTSAAATRSLYYYTNSYYGNPLYWSGTASPSPYYSTYVPNVRLAKSPAVSVTPAATGAFTNGVWSGSVTVSAAAAQMRLRASEAGGHTGDSNTFAVVSSQLAGFQWSTISSPQVQGNPIPVTLTAQRADGATLTSFNGTASLSGYAGSTNVQIGTGTSSWGYPLYTFYEDARTQVIYRASEIAGSGPISALSLDVTTLPGQVMNNWTIRMKHTSLGSYSTYAWEGPSSGWTTVYQANQSITTTGWVTFTFTTPFQYNGVDNLMIDFSFNNSSWSSAGASRYTSSSSTRSIYYYTDSGWGDPLNWSGTSSPSPYGSTYVPNLQLVRSAPVSITPTTTSAFANGVWSGSVTVLEAVAQMRLRADALGARSYSNFFDVSSTPPLTLSVPSSATEGDGTVAGTVGILAVPGSDLVVNLASSDASRVIVPAEVTILAGQTSAPLPMTIVDDSLLNGIEAVTITATAMGSPAVSGTIIIHDNETAALTVSLPASAREGDGVLVGAGTVTSSQPPTRDIAVQLVSSDPSEATVPATVTLRAGQTSASFNVTIVDDTVIDGVQTAVVTALVENWTSGTAGINVLDNDATISVTLPAEAWEGQGVRPGAGMVRIGGTLPSDLVVSLASNDLTELTVPATVTIPAGQTSRTFDLTIVDDSEWDGPQSVQVTASATGLTPGSASMLVRDNDVDHFGFDAVSSPQTAAVPFAVTTRAYDITGNTILVYNAPAALSGLGQAGPLPIAPTSITFASGVWTGNVTVNAVDPSVTLRVENAAGAFGTSNTFVVQSGPLDHFQWSTIASPQVENVPFGVTLTARDSHGYTVTSFAGTANLSGYAGSPNVQVGTGTSSWGFPLYTYTDDARTQVIYLATELGGSGLLSGLSLDVTVPPGQPMNRWTIRMKHTTLSSYATLAWEGPSSGWTTVYQANQNITTTGWVTFTFTTPFMYNGADNLMIDFSFNNASRSTGGASRCTDSGSIRTVYSYTNSVYGNPLDWSGAGAPYPSGGTIVPNIQLVGSPSPVSITPAAATFAHGTWTGNVTVLQTANNMYLHVDDGSGHLGDSNNFAVLSPLLAVAVPSNASEGDGTVAAAVGIPAALGSDLAVNLASSNTSRVTVPANVTIPAGQTSAPLPITIVDDTLLNGSEAVTISATATGCLPGSGTITVHDNEAATLTVSLPASAREGDGVLLGAGTVTASQSPTRDTVLRLSSSNTAALTVPATVTLPAGQASLNFDLSIVDDTLIEGTRTVDVTARVDETNWTSGSASINVLDNDATITVTLPAGVWEGQGVLPGAGTVRIGGTLASDVVVSLASSDLTELSVPASATIPAGQFSATFDLTIQDDGEFDGLQTVQVTATAAGFPTGSASMPVGDNELDHYGFDAISNPQSASVPFAVTARAYDITGNTILVYSGTAALSGLGQSGPLPITPTSIGFASGVWTENVTVDAVDPSVTLRLDNGAGLVATSNSFVVQPGPLDHFQWSTIASPQVQNAPFGVTLTAKDAYGYTVTSFAGTANLAGYAAAADVPIGAGISSWTVPLRTSYDDARTQVIYLASEIGGGGLINGLSLDVTILPGQVMNNWTIRMRHTSLGSYSTYAWEGPSSGWTTVYQADQSITTTGWVTFTFTTPFVYNGVANLMVDFSFNNSYYSTTGYSRYTSTPSTRSLYYTTNSSYGDPLDWSGTSSPAPLNSAWVPNIQLVRSSSVSVTPVTTSAFNNGVWSGSVTVYEVLNQMKLRASDTSGHLGDSNTFNVLPASPLTVTVPASAREGDGTVAAAVGIPAALGSDLVVNLASSNTSRVTVPANVTIPAGQTLAPLPITIVDDTLLNGIAAVTVSAAATGCLPGSGTITVHDNETATLTVSLPLSAREGDGVLVGAGTAAASQAPTRNTVVRLSSSNTAALTVPASVTLPAGQTAVNFDLSIVDDTLIEGTRTVAVNARVEEENWTSGSATITVLDNDDYMVLTMPSEAWEGQGVLPGAGTVRIGGTLASNLVLSLVSNDPTELTVPATVTIPAGQTSRTFDLTIQDDSEHDGPQQAQVTATATGLTPVSASMLVRDNDVDHFGFDTVSGPQTAAVPFAVTARAYDVLGNTIVVYNAAATLSGSSPGGPLPVAPTSVIFASGVWTDNVTISALDPGVTLRVENAAGAFGTSNTFAVQSGPLAHFQWGTVASPQLANAPFTATVTAEDANNYPVTGFNGSVTLGGWSGTNISQILLCQQSDDHHFQTALSQLGLSFVTYTSEALFNAALATADASTTLAIIDEARNVYGFLNAPGFISAGGRMIVEYGNLDTGVALATALGARVAADMTTPAPIYDWGNSSLFAGLTSPIAFAETHWVDDGDRLQPTGSGIAVAGFQSTVAANQAALIIANSGRTIVNGFLLDNAVSDAAAIQLAKNEIQAILGAVVTAMPIMPTTATFSNGVWTGPVTVTQDAAGMYLEASDGAGHVGRSNTFAVLVGSPLTLTAPASASEGDGTVAGAIGIPAALGSDLVVNLASGTPGRATVPANVTIPAGQTSAPLPITIVDNTLLDGIEAVAITATATGYLGASGTITVPDNETATLTVSLPLSAREGDGVLAGAGTVTASEAPTRDFVVQLSSSDITALTVPATVTLHAGQTSVNFNRSIIDDTLVQGARPIVVTAQVENWTSGSATITVFDNDDYIVLTLPGEAWEAQGVLPGAGTVRIGGTCASDLAISLVSADPTELTVPATAIIPAGQTSTTFDVSMVANGRREGPQSVQVTASAAGLTPGSATMLVRDSDPDHFTFDSISGAKTASVPFAVTIHVYDIFNNAILVCNTAAALSGSSPSGPLPVTPTSVSFASGVWAGSVAVSAVDPSVTLRVEDAAGAFGTSNTFAVQFGPLDHFQFGTVVSPQTQNAPFAATLAAQDAHGFTVTGFAGTASLSGWAGVTTSQTILGAPTPTDSSNSGTWTFGYAFTVSGEFEVTHVRHYSGSKVSIWTDSGQLLASQTFSDPPGAWVETALPTPVQLHAGVRYRVAVYTAGQTYYWRYDLPAASAVGSIQQSYYGSGDAFPTWANDTVHWWFVDLRGNYQTFSPVAVAPASATFANGLWTGLATVSQAATSVHLHTDDGSGHFGNSNVFDVLAAHTAPGTPDGEPTVVSRFLFYNHSAWDGYNPAASAADDTAIATDKQALCSGRASFANYSSYSRGINGIMVDIAGLPASNLSATDSAASSDFEFRVGSGSDPDRWQSSFDAIDPAPLPSSVTVREGAGRDGADRVTLIWADHAIQDTWLQVRILANARTRLAEDDLFYFGNVIGDCGNDPASAAVDEADELAARTHRTGFAAALITNPYDFNRDRQVNIADALLARDHASGFAPLPLITLPAEAAALQVSPHNAALDGASPAARFDGESTLATAALAAPSGGVAALAGGTRDSGSIGGIVVDGARLTVPAELGPTVDQPQLSISDRPGAWSGYAPPPSAATTDYQPYLQSAQIASLHGINFDRRINATDPLAAENDSPGFNPLWLSESPAAGDSPRSLPSSGAALEPDVAPVASRCVTGGGGAALGEASAVDAVLETLGSSESLGYDIAGDPLDGLYELEQLAGSSRWLEDSGTGEKRVA
jgi:uncharacterized protein YdeI (BOF family)